MSIVGVTTLPPGLITTFSLTEVAIDSDAIDLAVNGVDNFLVGCQDKLYLWRVVSDAEINPLDVRTVPCVK